jgi:putative transposase
LVDEQGGPLGVVIDGANVPDSQLLEATIEAVVIERPEPTSDSPQHLCLDKGYDNPTGRAAAASGGHTPHIRCIGEEKRRCDRKQGHKPRR